MHERQRSLALVEVAENLLAVCRLVADEVEQIVTDLEGRAEVKPEAHQRRQFRRAARPDDRADPQRMDGGVPARLVHDQVEVVLGLQLLDIVELPPDLGRLSLQGAHRHRVELGPDQVGEVPIEAAGGPAQHLPGDHRKAVAGIQRGRQPVLRRQRRPTAAHLAAVGDVVVDEKGVVQQLDCDRDAQKVVASAPNARPADRHSAGRSALPGRDGYSRIGPYSHCTGSPSGIASSMARRTNLRTSRSRSSTESMSSAWSAVLVMTIAV